jgi:glycosyltransferase involved in cell wall biosynthesis
VPHIFHVTEDHSPANTGVTEVITQLSRYLTGQGWPTTVLTAGKAVTPVPAGVGLVEFPIRPAGRIWRYPDKLKAFLQEIKRDMGNIFHLHGVWGAPQWLAARAAVRQKVPALLTAHDMLSPWHWQDGRLRQLKKVIYWFTLAYPAFRKLPLIHAITVQERQFLARLFPGQKIEVIPNAIDLSEVDATLSCCDKVSRPDYSIPYLLFLGRLHHKKGVDILIKAFAAAFTGRDVKLLIVGPDSSAGYTEKLKSLANRLGVSRQVTFRGPVFGTQKYALFQRAWAFCLPSQSEVVGLANLEAAATATPGITTHETGLGDWEEGGGILVSPRVPDLTQALKRVFSWSLQERNERGGRLRRLVEGRYSWEAVGPLWLHLYQELACGRIS